MQSFAMIDIFGVSGKNIKNKQNVVYVRAYEDEHNIIIKIGQTRRSYNERDKEYPPIIPIFDMAAIVSDNIDLSKIEDRLREFADFLCATLGGKKQKIDWFVFSFSNPSKDCPKNNNIGQSSTIELVEQNSAVELVEQILEETWNEYNEFDEYDNNEQINENTVEMVVSELVKQLDLNQLTNTVGQVAQRVAEVGVRMDKLEKDEFKSHKSSLCEHLYVMFGSFLAGIESVTIVSGTFFNNSQSSFLDKLNGNGNGKNS